MASFPAINRFSFGQPAPIRPEISNLGEDNVPLARDVRDAVGFSNCEDLGLIAFQPRTAEGDKSGRPLLSSQLLSQSYQETLRSLSAAGVPAQFVALADENLGASLESDPAIAVPGGSNEFGQSTLDRDYGYLAGPVSSPSKAVQESADWYKDEPYHQAPAFGSD